MPNYGDWQLDDVPRRTDARCEAADVVRRVGERAKQSLSKQLCRTWPEAPVTSGHKMQR